MRGPGYRSVAVRRAAEAEAERAIQAWAKGDGSREAGIVLGSANTPESVISRRLTLK